MMQSGTVSHLRIAGAAPPPATSLLLDLPADIVPNIYQRLPGPDLFRFSRICRQTHASSQHLTQSWACQELDEIVFLQGPQSWDRFLDFIANCSHMITPDMWHRFIGAVASRSKELAILLQLAYLSPARSRGDERLDGGERLQAAAGSTELLRDLWSFVHSARTSTCMERAAVAVFTGLWWCECSGQRRGQHAFLGAPFTSMVGTLSFKAQIKLLPVLDQIYRKVPADIASAAEIELAYGAVSQMHTNVLHLFYSHPTNSFDFPGQSKSYLAWLANQFRYDGTAHRNCCNYIAKSLKLYFGTGASTGEWRNHTGEFAQLAFLAFQSNPDDTFRERLISGGFVTAQECSDFFSFIAAGADSRFDRVSLWLSLNRDKPRKPVQDDSKCTIS